VVSDDVTAARQELRGPAAAHLMNRQVRADTTHVLFNNCYSNYAQVNARELAERLGGRCGDPGSLFRWIRSSFARLSAASSLYGGGVPLPSS
jgi:hypothetical protein